MRIAWSVPWRTRFDVNAADPVICSEGAVVSSGYEVGSALFDPRSGREVWCNKAIRAQCSPLVRHEGHVYGFDGYIDAGPGSLKCVETATGRTAWEQRDLMGNLIVVDGFLLILTTGGVLALADASPEGYRPRGRVRVLKGPCWVPPSYADGRVYCRDNGGRVACVQVSGRSGR